MIARNHNVGRVEGNSVKVNWPETPEKWKLGKLPGPDNSRTSADVTAQAE